jgi:hypothetical protein
MSAYKHAYLDRIAAEQATYYGVTPDKLYDVNGNAVGTHRATGRR